MAKYKYTLYVSLKHYIILAGINPSHCHNHYHNNIIMIPANVTIPT